MIHETFSGLLVSMMELQPLMVELVRHELQQGPGLTRIWSEQESGPPEEAPLYENHFPVAEEVWRQLPDRVVLREQTYYSEQATKAKAGKDWPSRNPSLHA